MEPRLTNPFGQPGDAPAWQSGQQSGQQPEQAAPNAPQAVPSWPPQPLASGDGMAQVVPLRGENASAPAAVPASAPGVPAASGEVVVRTPVGEVVRGWYGSALNTGRAAVTGGAVFREQLPSIAGLWREMAEADWAPEEATFLRFVGRAYRLLVVIPASLIAYTGLWIIQRPLRLFLAIAVSAIAVVFIFILN